MNLQRLGKIFDINNVELVSLTNIEGRYRDRLLAEIKVDDKMVIFESTNGRSSGLLIQFSDMLKDEDQRYLISNILEFSNLDISSQSALDRINHISDKDPDESLYALRMLIGIENSDSYLSESKELISAIGGTVNSFSLNNIKLQYDAYYVSCSSILGNVSKRYISEKSAELINPITAYLDTIGVLDKSLSKIRMLKLQDI